MNPIDTLDALEAKLQPPGAQPPADPYANDNSFVRGIRSGAFGAGSQLSTLAGAVGESLGADQFAKAAYTKGRGLRGDASRAAPLVNQWADVHGAGDFGSYVAGQVGASLPAAAGALGAAALTGGAAVPSMLAAGAAMAPLEIGDMLQRQQDRGESVDLGKAALYGGASAALQGVVPGMARVKLAGGLGAGARQTLRQAVARELPAIPEQAALGTGGEALKQYGTAGELDPSALGEAAISNAVGGLPFAAAGVAGRVAHGGAGVPGSQMLGDAYAKGRKALGKASEAVGDAIPRGEDGGIDLSSAVAKGRDAVSGIDLGAIKESVQDAARRIADGLPMREHLDKLRTAAEDALPETAMAEAKDRMSKAATWAGDLLNDVKLTPQRRAEVAAAAQDLTKDANVKIVAGAKAAQEAGRSWMGALSGFYNSVSQKFKDGKAKVDADMAGIDVGPKQSRVYEGMRHVIYNIVAPIVEQNYPQAMQDPTARNRLAEVLRVTAETMSSGKEPPAEHQRYLRILFGDEYTDVLGSIGEAMVDAGKTPKFLAQLNKLDAAQSERKTRMQRLAEALPDHTRDELSQMDEQLQRFMSPEFTRGLDRATAELRLRNVRRQVAKAFGDKADTILEAYGPQVREENQLQNAGRPLEADSADDGVDFTDRLEEGAPNVEVVSKRPVMSPGNAMKEYGDAPGQTKAEREIARAEKREGVRARWVDAAEYTKLTGKDAGDVPAGHGFVVAETLPAGDALSARELSAMKLDKQRQAKDKTQHDSKITAGPHEFDAIKVAKVMLATLPSDDRGSQVRMADAFMQGVAKLTEHYGDVVNVPDSTVIVKNGKKSLTYGEAKKLNLNAVEAGSSGSGNEPVARTYDELKSDLAQVKTDYAGAKKDRVSAEELAKIVKRGERIEHELAKIRVTDDAAANGSYEVNPDTNIHTAAAALSADELRHTFNMDGTRVKHGGSEPSMDRSGQITPNGLRVLDSFLSRAETRRQRADAMQRAAATKLVDAATQHIAALKDNPGAMNSVQTRNLIAALHPEQKLSAALELMPPMTLRYAAAKPAKVEAPARVDYAETPKGERPDQRARGQFIDMSSTPRRSRGEAEIPSGTAFASAEAERVRDHERNWKPKSQGDLFDQPADKTVDVLAKTPKLDRMLATEDFKALDTRAKVDVFLDRAERRFKELSAERERLFKNDEELPDQQRQAFIKLSDMFGEGSSFDRESLYDGVEDTPSPKALAAKKAAFLEAARSGDPELIKHLERSTDAKGLQRAVEALGNEKLSPEVQRTVDTINKRLGELVQNDDVRYGMGTKKYSLMSTQIHEDLGRPGFAAAHVSNDQHSGSFDWRANLRKGQGDSKAGAGTYLSISDASAEHFKNVIRGAPKKRRLFGDVNIDTGGVRSEPLTYHVSVDAEPHQIMLWDEKLSKQPVEVRDAILKTAKDLGVPDKQIASIVADDPPAHELYSDDLYNRVFDMGKVSDALAKNGVVGAKYRAGKGAEYVIYDDSKISTNYVQYDSGAKPSRQSVNPQGTTTNAQRAEVTNYIRDVLGPTVKTVFANIMHAGEFEPGRAGADDIVRVSVHSLNPMSVAYHESLHGFFKRLTETGNADVVNILKRAADSAITKNQLRKLLAGEPDALRQLEDPEERAAYMYQFWATKDASGKRLLEVGTQTHGVFERIKAALLKVLGVWTNDERALHIMAAFQDGKFKDPGTTSAAARAVMAQGRNATLDKVGAMTQPLRHLGESIAASGGAKLRETGVPALVDVANGMKRALHDEGEDAGFIPAARVERTRRMNDLASALAQYTPDEMNEALVAMQSGAKPASLNARVIARITKNVLRNTLGYMKDAGVKVNDLGEDYFPRVYDPAKIEANRIGFESMLTAHGYDGKAIADKLIANSGVYTNVVDRPGMQHTKQRKLVDIPDNLVQPFLKEDFIDTMSSYVYQATRRAEWARRWGDEGERLEAKLGEARRQGATTEQLDDARKYIRGVDGTLGDDINPNLRKLFGTAIAYQNVRLLPLAIFSSVVDPMGITVRGGTVGDAWSAFKRGLKEAIPAVRGALKNDHWAEMAEIMGTVDAAALSHTMGEIYGQGMMGDTTKKINDGFFKFNLMEGFNRSMRVAATEAAVRFIGKHADLKASEHSARWIAELGLRPEDIVRNPDGSVKLSERDGLTPEQASTMRMAVNKWVDGAVLRPDAADKPVWMNDPHWALVSHLKQFTYSFHETILKRVIHEHKFGNYKPAMAMASYVPIMIAADLLKAGITPRDPDWDKDAGPMLMHGVERSGLLGVGQIALDAGHGLGGLTGPTIEQLIESVEVLGGRRSFQSFALRAMPANSLYVGDGAETRAAE